MTDVIDGIPMELPNATMPSYDQYNSWLVPITKPGAANGMDILEQSHTTKNTATASIQALMIKSSRLLAIGQTSDGTTPSIQSTLKHYGANPSLMKNNYGISAMRRSHQK